MRTKKLPVITDEEEMYLDHPYGGLFGDSVIASVVEELVADPTMDYRPKYLEKITGKSQKSIYTALKKLIDLKLIEKVGDDQHPVFRVRVASKKFIALSFLAYAMLDDREGSDCMDMAIHDYYESVLKSRYEPWAIATINRYDIAEITGNDHYKQLIVKTTAASA